MNKEEEYEEARATLERLDKVMARRSASADHRTRVAPLEGAFPEDDAMMMGMSGDEGGGGPDSPTGSRSPTAPLRTSAAADIMASLERSKFRLMAETAKHKRTLADLNSKVEEARAKMEARRARLSQYNGLFLRMGPEAAQKAPRQRLGAADAVLGTKRIIERELTRVRKEGDVVNSKLNRAKEHNAKLRASIDGQRKDAMTFRKLFVSMSNELEGLKTQLALTHADVSESYEARDRAHEDMRQLAKQFEVDKLERAQEWAVFSEAIEAANREGGPEKLETASGLLTQQEEEELRRKIKRGQQKMEKDRRMLQVRAIWLHFDFHISIIRLFLSCHCRRKHIYLISPFASHLQLAETKLGTYTAALESIRAATGEQDLNALVDIFQRCVAAPQALCHTQSDSLVH